jgi:hypothetical protein
MANLELLIRLARRTTEEHQVELADLGRAHAAAEADIAAHDDAVAAESLLAGSDLDALAAFSAWGPVAGRQGAHLRRRSGEIAQAEIAAQDRLHQAFVEMKRLEIAQAAVLDTQQRADQRKAEATADDREQIRRSHAAG